MPENNSRLDGNWARDGVGASRRSFLKVGAGALVLGVTGDVLAGCASSSPSSGPAGGLTVATPKRGGTLNIGLTGGASSDTIDGQKPVTDVDIARVINLYDALVVWDLSARPKLSLAESIEPNADATEWTIRLRPGVTFHNGKPLTAEDVIYSYQRVVNNKLAGAAALGSCNVNEMRKLDNLTVRIPCTSPFGDFINSTVGFYFFLNILPVGYDPRNPVGTGPFKYKSFSPGVESVFVRNNDYWNQPYPYVDELVINDFADETSQVNALSSGTLDGINSLSAASISPVESAGNKTLIAQSGGMTPITMRVDLAPFNDARVRQALRLCVNRPQMLEVVFGGHGRIGNDVFSPYDPEYDNSLPQRQQDIDQAKFLLKQAGHENLQLTMQTADILQGCNQMAQVFAEQASAAGVKISLQQMTVTEFYGPNYLKWPLGVDGWQYAAYLPQVAASMLPTSPYNETHWASPDPPTVGPEYIRLYKQAAATTDVTTQTGIVHEMMRTDYNLGGYIIPYFPPLIDGYSSKLRGVAPGRVGLSFGNYSFAQMWFE